jgi:hypothetical protein
MKIDNIELDFNYIECINCGDLTNWKDGVCTDCSMEVPDHIHVNQHKKLYLLKRKKDEV